MVDGVGRVFTLTEVLTMREICPSCGKDMVVTTEAFEINGDAVRGVPHLLCRSCGEVTFTPEQLDMLFGYRTAQKQLKTAKRPA